MTDINRLLETYDSGYVPGERRSTKYNNRKKIKENVISARIVFPF